MSLFTVLYLNSINQRREVITVLGYSANTVARDFNTYGGNLSVIAVEQK